MRFPSECYQIHQTIRQTMPHLSQGNRILSILEYLTPLNIAKIDNSLGKSEFIG